MWVAPVIFSQASNAGQSSAIDEIAAALSFAEEESRVLLSPRIVTLVNLMAER